LAPLSKSACLATFELCASPSCIYRSLPKNTFDRDQAARKLKYKLTALGELGVYAIACISGRLVYAGVVTSSQTSTKKAAQEHQQEGASGDR